MGSLMEVLGFLCGCGVRWVPIFDEERLLVEPSCPLYLLEMPFGRNDFLIWYMCPLGGKKDPKLTLSLIHLFSCNCLDTLLTFLGKFCDTLLPVWSQRQSLSVSNASVLVSLATCVLQLLKRLLGSLLDSGGEEFQFRDTRVAGMLLRAHMVLCSAPYFTVAINAAHEVRTFQRPTVEAQWGVWQLSPLIFGPS